MNLILDAFERVFNPNNTSNDKRRASSYGLITAGPTASYSSSSRRTTNTTMTTTTSSNNTERQPLFHQRLDSPQNNFRRQSGGTINAGFQNEFVALTIDEPTTSIKIQRQQSANSGSRSRSSNAGGSRRQRKKSISASGSDKSHSMASLIFSALSSPTSINGNDNTNRMRRRRLNNGNRVSGRRKQLPPRQWSVPEREGNNDYNREEQNTVERNLVAAEPFRLIQKAYSLCCEDPPQLPSSSRSSLMGSPHSPLSISSHNCFNSGSTILLGFVTCQNVAASSNASLQSKLALESGRMLDSELYLLRCIDTEPKLPFIYYASVAPSSDHELHINSLTETLVDIGDNSIKIQLGCYEELYTLERAALDNNISPSPPPRNSLKHQGFILIFFRLLGENNGSSADLESRWLNWTGAGQIYKYSPRCWDLQKVCLLKSLQHSDKQDSTTSFAYVLLCEFNSILHPSNTIAALDLCERLRTRNCGYVALYKVSQCCSSQKQQQKQYSHHQQKSFEYQQKETNLSPNWPLQQQQYRRQQLGRMGRSHDERVSIGARKEQQHSPPSPRPSCEGETEKGHSQQSLNDRGGTERLRRLIWAREHQHSLGWDQKQPQQWFGQPTNGTLL